MGGGGVGSNLMSQWRYLGKYSLETFPSFISACILPHVSDGTCFYKSLPRPFVSGNNLGVEVLYIPRLFLPSASEE